jgi:hypothetical protein
MCVEKKRKMPNLASCYRQKSEIQNEAGRDVGHSG